VHHPRIVIVDDDENIGSVLELLSQEAEPKARIAVHQSCVPALQQIETGGADLVITDYHLPGMSGPAMVKILRQNKPSLPVIVVSGDADARDVSTKAGANRFIHKRFLFAQLPDAIHALLRAS
jgi:DNA-binding response OmpR family regulator